MLETTKPKWYENKTLIVLLFFILPPLGIYGMTKRKTVSWKKVLYIVPASFLILLTIIGIIGAIFIDYYKDGIEYYNKKEYIKAYDNLKMVDSDDPNYKDAISKLNEIKPIVDSIIANKNTIKEVENTATSTKPKKNNIDFELLKGFQKKWTDSVVKVENTPINGNHLVGSKLVLPDTIYLEYSAGVTKEGFEINMQNDTTLYRKWYKDALLKKLGTDYANYPVYIIPIANRNLVSKIDKSINYVHPALAFEGIRIYKGNDYYKEFVGNVVCVYDDPDKGSTDMYNKIVMIRTKKGVAKITYYSLRKNYWTTEKENDLSQTELKCN